MKRILIIDSEYQVGEMLKLIFEQAGFEATYVWDGFLGFSLQRQNPFDLIITEIAMPEINGIEMLIRLKKEFPGVKVIVFSAGGVLKVENPLHLAKELGADHTFLKPVTRKKMLGVVHKVLST